MNLDVKCYPAVESVYFKTVQIVDIPVIHFHDKRK